MGNLHAGHLTLVQHAKRHGRPVVVSIFVNPLQFGAGEDYTTYPRTLDHDCALLRPLDCDVVFAPSVAVMFPETQSFRVVPDPALADILEGQFRPGFFIGVCTIVAKLFHCIQPTVAVFGKKDYQQLRVVEAMVRQLCMPITIEPVDTVREVSGLALSSRNGYLDEIQRAQAPQLLQALQGIARQGLSGRRDWDALAAEALETLKAQGWSPDYVTVRRQDNLQAPEDQSELVILAAARIGSTRLIDSLELSAS